MRQRQGTVSLLPSDLVNVTGMVMPGAQVLQIRDINHLLRSVQRFTRYARMETPAAGIPHPNQV